MLHCILGAIMCSASATITVPGKLAYAPTYPAAGAWNYVINAAPVLNPQPFTVVTIRRV